MKKVLQISIFLLVTVSYTLMAQESWPRFRNDLTQTGFTDNAGPLTNHESWMFMRDGSPIVSSPAVVAGKVYFGSMDSSVFCLNSSTGEAIWSFHTNGPIYYSSPAVAGGKVYIGSWDGFLYCLDAETGDSIWTFNTYSPTGFNSCPAVVGDKVYFGSNNSYIYCLDANSGDEVWSYKTGMGVWCSPAIADNRLYIGSFDGKMRCLDATTGDSIWATSVSMVYSSPAIFGDKLYFGSILGANTYCLNIADGSILWQRSLNGAIFSSPAVYNGRLFIGVDQVAQEGGRMFCLDASTGDSLWSIFHSNFGSVYSSPAVTDSMVYYGAMNNHAYCVRQSNGEIVWDYGTYNQVLTSPAIADNSVFFGTKDGLMICVKDLDVAVPVNASLPELINIYPNPASDRVKINFKLDQISSVKITINDMQGRYVNLVTDQTYPAGEICLFWEGCDNAGLKVPRGIYFCHLTINNITRTEKIMIY